MNDVHFDPVMSEEMFEQTPPYLIEIHRLFASTLDYPFNEMIKKVLRGIDNSFLTCYIKNDTMCREAGLNLFSIMVYPNTMEITEEEEDLATGLFASLTDLEWLRRQNVLDYFINDAESAGAPNIVFNYSEEEMRETLAGRKRLNRPNTTLLDYLDRRENEVLEEDEKEFTQKRK